MDVENRKVGVSMSIRPFEALLKTIFKSGLPPGVDAVKIEIERVPEIAFEARVTRALGRSPTRMRNGRISITVRRGSDPYEDCIAAICTPRNARFDGMEWYPLSEIGGAIDSPDKVTFNFAGRESRKP